MKRSLNKRTKGKAFVLSATFRHHIVCAMPVRIIFAYCVPLLHFYVLTTLSLDFNALTPNDPYSGRTAPLTSKRCILYIYSTNIRTEYFKHSIYSPFFFSSSKCSLFHKSNVFGSCIIHILYIYSTNIGTEYFKHGIYSPFFPLQNAVCFIIPTYFVPVLFTIVLKLKKIIPAPKG